MRKDQPLWLPPGSVRAIGFLMMLAFAMLIFAVGRPMPAEFWTLFGGVAGWYYGSRKDERGGE